jgi:hypothetical protein
MEAKQLVKLARAFAKPFRATDGKDFRLKAIDPADTLGLGSEDKPRSNARSGTTTCWRTKT